MGLWGRGRRGGRLGHWPCFVLMMFYSLFDRFPYPRISLLFFIDVRFGRGWFLFWFMGSNEGFFFWVFGWAKELKREGL